MGPAGAPVRKPLENLRETVLRYLMRPEPVVFLRLAFSPQLSVLALTDVRGAVRGAARGRTLAGLSSRVAARSAGVLLDVEGAATCATASQQVSSGFPGSRFVRSGPRRGGRKGRGRRRSRRTATPAQRVRLVVALAEAGGTLGHLAGLLGGNQRVREAGLRARRAYLGPVD